MEKKDYIHSCVYKYLYEMMNINSKYYFTIKDISDSNSDNDIIKFDSRQIIYYYVITISLNQSNALKLSIKYRNLGDSNDVGEIITIHNSDDLSECLGYFKSYLDNVIMTRG